MKQPMSAQEWFESQGNQTKTNYHIDEYANYLLKHHLEQFADECVNECIFEDEYKLANKIDQTLNDYLTKNNI